MGEGPVDSVPGDGLAEIEEDRGDLGPRGVLGRGEVRIARRLAHAEGGDRGDFVRAISLTLAREGALQDTQFLSRGGAGQGLQEGPAESRGVLAGVGEYAAGEGTCGLDELGVIERDEGLERRDR